MNTRHTRRYFLKSSCALVALAAATPCTLTAAETLSSQSPRKRTNAKAIMWATIGLKGSVLDKMKAVKSAGFDAVEMMSHMNQTEVLKARDEPGLAIVSVCGEKHWSIPLSHPDVTVREAGFAALQQTLRDAKAYGATSILLVPGVVNKEVSFDECWNRSIEQIKRALPLAEELGVKISIENVWNNFITTETQAAKYLDQLNSPWVAWHFDVGNILRYGDPLDWIKTLGKRISRVHVKEYSRDRALRVGDVWKGFDVPLLEGANNWPAVIRALDDIGYTGAYITEQPGGDTAEGLRDLATRLEKILDSAN